jgi:hypothetical protein
MLYNGTSEQLNQDHLVRIIQVLDEAIAMIDDHEAALGIVVVQECG